MVDPTYVMHWAENIPNITTADGLAKVTLFAGSLESKKGLPPPPDSWAASPENEVTILHIVLSPGGSFSIPAAATQGTNRMAYYVEGDSLEADGKPLQLCSMVLDPDVPLQLRNPSAAQSPAEVLVLHGRPIAEPVAQQGPFVMNTRQELEQAYRDYQKTRFGGWPWPQDAVVFPRDKGRFSSVKGVEERPPGA